MTLVVNKIDLPEHAPRLSEFHRLGFERTRGVSAEHGRGAWDALEELARAAARARRRRGAGGRGGGADRAGGPPNVGKSSLLNRLVGEERVVVSDVPGTTRDAVDVRVEHAGERFLLVDTAGLRRAGRRTRSAEHGSALMTVRALERANVALVVIDAATAPPTRTPASRPRARARLRGGPARQQVGSRLGASGARALARRAARRLRFLGDAPLLTVSAQTGAGIGRIFELSQRLARRPRARIATAELNRWLSKRSRCTSPRWRSAVRASSPLKFFYATQPATRPPTFVLFCSEPDAVQRSYRRFLENQLRESFGLAGAPVRLRLRKRTQKEAPSAAQLRRRRPATDTMRARNQRGESGEAGIDASDRDPARDRIHLRSRGALGGPESRLVLAVLGGSLATAAASGAPGLAQPVRRRTARPRSPASRRLSACDGRAGGPGRDPRAGERRAAPPRAASTPRVWPRRLTGWAGTRGVTARLQAGTLQAELGEEEAALATWRRAAEDAPADSVLAALAQAPTCGRARGGGRSRWGCRGIPSAPEIAEFPGRVPALGDAARCFAQAGQTERARPRRPGGLTEGRSGAGLPVHVRARG